MFWLIICIACLWMIYCHYQNWKIVIGYSGDREKAGEKGYILPAITGNMTLFTSALYIVLAAICFYKFIKPFLQL